MRKLLTYKPGPGALVTAAFIGPGTIATCSIAGARFGFALLWGLLFSVLATIILQEMAARLGVVTQQGLGEALRRHYGKTFPRLAAAVLVISAIAIGNAAFEAGNIMGATMGLESAGLNNLADKIGIAGGGTMRYGALLIGIVSFVVLLSGSYKLIEGVLIALVIIMSLTFFATAVIVAPPPLDVLSGLLVPRMPGGSTITLLGIIGTTVVPYNLFLYASAVSQKWKHQQDIPAVRWDISVSVMLGGLISMAIIISAAMAFYKEGTIPASGQDLARQLEPLTGKWSAYLVGFGLFAAGISSAITAPLAAAWATTGILGWSRDMHSWRFRLVWMTILAIGTTFAMMGLRPMEVIVFAQAANGILLPIVAIYLYQMMNSKKIMGDYTNGWISNSLGAFVVLITLILGLRTIYFLL